MVVFVEVFYDGGQYPLRPCDSRVNLTRGVFAGEVVGGLDRIATSALLPNVV